jgi:hypothetical protein
VVGGSDEPIISLLSFLERLKNNDENTVKQSSMGENIRTLSMAEKKSVDEPKPKKRKGLRR